MSTYSDDDLLLLSGIQHFAYCERQWALIHIEQQWQENVKTVEGKHLHERVHNPELVEKRGDLLVTRSLPIVSWRLGLYGMMDLAEFHQVSSDEGGIKLPNREGFWLPKPVEYKRGKPKADDRDEVQLCAQAICLEEMLQVRIEEGDLYYGENRRRVMVVFDPALRGRVEELSRRMHQVFASGITPPAAKGHRCSLCSLKDICMPTLTRKSRSVKSYIEKEISDSTP